MRYLSIFFTFCLIFVAGCAHKEQESPMEAAPMESMDIQSERPIVTIWVHGTKFWPDTVLPQHFFCEYGLHKPDTLPEHYRLRMITRTLGECGASRFSSEHMYLFGWSGTLSFAARKQTGIELHDALHRLLTEYKTTYGITPILKIITHSHGGNVLLNCIAHAQQTQSDIVFDECIFLACPVQQETAHIIASTHIKKAYSLFSTMDSVQILDPQGIYKEKPAYAPLLSERMFPHAPYLIQAQIKTTYRGLMHVDFIREYFIRLLPAMLDALDAHEFAHTPEKHLVIKINTRKATLQVSEKRRSRKDKDLVITT